MDGLERPKFVILWAGMGKPLSPFTNAIQAKDGQRNPFFINQIREGFGSSNY